MKHQTLVQQLSQDRQKRYSRNKHTRFAFHYNYMMRYMFDNLQLKDKMGLFQMILYCWMSVLIHTYAQSWTLSLFDLVTE